MIQMAQASYRSLKCLPRAIHIPSPFSTEAPTANRWDATDTRLRLTRGWEGGTAVTLGSRLLGGEVPTRRGGEQQSLGKRMLWTGPPSRGEEDAALGGSWHLVSASRTRLLPSWIRPLDTTKNITRSPGPKELTV